MVGFLSTLSLRRATLMWYQCNTVVKISIHALLAESDTVTARIIDPTFDFYPRSPCGERLYDHVASCQTKRISIHALLAESDQASTKTSAQVGDFYPRSPCGERRGSTGYARISVSISIHALLAESDARQIGQAESQSPFLSTLSLRRATVCKVRMSTGELPFLSTLSLRRATEMA